jgi:hypothetical protein
MCGHRQESGLLRVDLPVGLGKERFHGLLLAGRNYVLHNAEFTLSSVDKPSIAYYYIVVVSATTYQPYKVAKDGLCRKT